MAALGEKAVAMGMGLHAGLAVVGENRTAPAGIAVVGKTITQAVTLQEHAVGGTILCSETTARLVRRVVRLVAVEPLPATAQSALGKAYQILGRKVRRGPAALAVTPLVERTRALAVLQAVWTQVEVGQGPVVGIVGEPGMGKSRLVHEFCRSLRGGPHTYVRGYCVSYGQALPYQPVRALLQHACGITEADSPTAIAAKVQRRLRALDMNAKAAVSYLLLLLGRQEVPQQLAGLSPEVYRASMFAALLQMCLNVSRRRPLVIEVEDLHWIDASSEACLMALVEQGQVAAGMAQMQQSMSALHLLRTEDGQATHLAQLAKMYGRAGRAEEGWRLLAEAMAARQDTEERFDDVGRLRLKGELLLMLPHPDGHQAESYFHQALAMARQQQAKSLELRTALCLSRLWQQQGQRDKARQLLTPIYGWFTEGFEIADLREAKVLLEKLGGR